MTEPSFTALVQAVQSSPTRGPGGDTLTLEQAKAEIRAWGQFFADAIADWDAGARKAGAGDPAGRARREQFDAVAETSQFADHLACPHLLRLGADGRPAFFVAHALMQDLPDQSTQPVGDGADGLRMGQGGGRVGDTPRRRSSPSLLRRHWRPD